MIRTLLPLLFAAAPASAHTGHFGELAGHDHWVLGVGLGAIAGAAVIGWLKGGKAKEDDTSEEVETSDEEEQTA